MTSSTALAPRIPWDKFLRTWQWTHGQHITILGTTGHGKSYLLRELAKRREYAVVFATKPRDSTMDGLIASGFTRISTWAEHSEYKNRNQTRFVLWPDASTTDSVKLQKQVFEEAFKAIYVAGAWSVFLDEGYYIAQTLGLGNYVKLFYLQARSLDISLVMATQRPTWVPLEAYDQASWLYIGPDSDRRNLQRLSELGYRNSSAIMELVPELEDHQWLVLNTRTGAMVRTRVQL